MRLNAIVTHEPPWYVARCVEVDVVSQGGTAEEAAENLRAALSASPVLASPHERPVLTEVDVPVTMAAGGGTARLDRIAFARRAEALGWQVERHGESEEFRSPGGSRVVWLPLGAERVAPGVFRMLDVAPTPGGEAADALDRIDALFARHPHHDDTTRIVREQRDAG